MKKGQISFSAGSTVFNNKNKLNLFELFHLDFPLLLLVISNIFTIYLAISQNWNLITIMWVFWIQSVIIGIFNFIRILTLNNFTTDNFKINGKQPSSTKFTKYYTAFFYLIHYGLFHFVYMIFLLSTNGIFNGKYLSYNNSVNPADIIWIILTAIIFFGNHLYSFIANYENDSKKIRNIGTVMFFPYARIIPMHLTIVFGVFLYHSAAGILFFMFLKTIADVVMHQIEHHI